LANFVYHTTRKSKKNHFWGSKFFFEEAKKSFFCSFVFSKKKFTSQKSLLKNVWYTKFHQIYDVTKHVIMRKTVYLLTNGMITIKNNYGWQRHCFMNTSVTRFSKINDHNLSFACNLWIKLKNHKTKWEDKSKVDYNHAR
jgi:hypothetical protein